MSFILNLSPCLSIKEQKFARLVDEFRAYTIKKSTKAPQAAGKIHSDFERGFIAAEVISFNDLMKYKYMFNSKNIDLYAFLENFYTLKYK